MTTQSDEVQVTCPKCKAEISVSVERYVCVSRNPEVNERLLEGLLGTHKCSCGFIGIVSIPMIYNDPSRDLCVFICDGDRESLIDEFHGLLAYLNVSIPADELNSILSRSFQVMVGFSNLARVVYALDHDIFCYRMTPGINEATQFDYHNFLIIAKYYRLAQRHDAAYAVVRVPYDFGYRDPELLRELGAYAFSANQLDEAETLLLEAQKRVQALSHLWEQIVAAEGMVTQIPKEVALPKLAEAMKPKYQAMRPECHFGESDLARIAGSLMALFAVANDQLGDQWELKFYQEHTEYAIKQFLDGADSERDLLVKEIQAAQHEVTTKIQAEQWSTSGLISGWTRAAGR